MSYYNLFNYMKTEHGLTLLDEEMQEIERMLELDKKETINGKDIKHKKGSCPEYDICMNRGKNEYCNNKTLKEIDCFIIY